MVFWKRLFSNSDTVTPTQNLPFDGEILEVTSDTASQSRIFFSTEREIDLYELEELCDAVGWARRPLRKVKKALEYSFLVVSMWEVKETEGA